MIAASTAIKWGIINEARQLCGVGAQLLRRRRRRRCLRSGASARRYYPTLRAAIAGDALGAAAVEVRRGAPDIALSQVTLLPPITDPDKIIWSAAAARHVKIAPRRMRPGILHARGQGHRRALDQLRARD